MSSYGSPTLSVRGQALQRFSKYKCPLNVLPPPNPSVFLPKMVEGDGSDAQVSSSAVVQQGNETIQAGTDAVGNLYSYIVPMSLPVLQAGQTITAATIKFNFAKKGTPTTGLALYGLTRFGTTPQPATTDAYSSATTDPSNTLLQAGFILPATTPGQVTYTFSGAGLTWLNAQYANFAATPFPPVRGGRFVFFRLSPEGISTFNTAYQISTTNDFSSRANIPVMSLTVSTGTLSATAGRVVFEFTTPAAGFTSCGVYDSTTGGLLRTVWANIPYSAGQQFACWDGLDDNGNALAGAYTLKVGYHNTIYTWDGVYGNTSSVQTGPTVWHSLVDGPVRSLAIDPTGGTSFGYWPAGYNERYPFCNSFDITAPQTNNAYTGTQNLVFNNVDFVATDGTIVYWAKVAGGENGSPGGGGQVFTYIFGTNMAMTAKTTFSAGSTIPNTNGQLATSGFDYDSSTTQGDPASGLAVQPTGNFCLVSHGTLGVVRVFNKTTGAAASASPVTVTTPGPSCCDVNNNFYVISGTNVLMYSVNAATGALTLLKTFSGFNAPGGVAVNPTGVTLAVADGGTQQQIKLINIATSAQLSAYGVIGGMPVNGGLATNTNLWMGTAAVATYPIKPFQISIAYAPNGDIWFGEKFNNRMQHIRPNIPLATSFTWIESVSYLTETYCSTLNVNDDTSLFATFVEFTINYALSPGGTNGSWTMKANWLASLNPANFTGHQQSGLQNVFTPPSGSGRVYGLAYDSSVSQFRMLELVQSTGVARDTGLLFPNPNPGRFDATGTFYTDSSSSPYASDTQTITGYTSNNPTLSSKTALARITLAADDPRQLQQDYYRTTLYQTSGGYFAVYQNGLVTPFWHLATYKAGDTSFRWRGLRDLGASYVGNFPRNDTFDVANGTAYAGSITLAHPSRDRMIACYRGEFWNNAEAGINWDYHESGLMMGFFGRVYYPSDYAVQPFMAGNPFSPNITNHAGKLQFWYNDETNHGGIHRVTYSNETITWLQATNVSVGQYAHLS